MQEDATALARAIRAGHLTATDAMAAAIGAAQAADHLGCISALVPDLGLAHAAALDRAAPDAPVRQAPFAGVPTLAKDLGGPFPGLPVTAGSRLLTADDGGSEGSDLADRFLGAGLCPFGLTTVPEFGLSLASEPALGPVARNPLDPRLSPGGSSGGAAAAVAAGIVAIAHATDAGGSIRVPAAACGLIGLKPGRGTVPQGPGFGNHLGGIAAELAVCRSVRDCAAILSACAGDTRGPFPPVAGMAPPAGPLRIGLLTETGEAMPTDADQAAAVEEAGRALEGRDHRLVPLGWLDLAAMAAESDRAFRAIVSVNLAELVDRAGLDATLAEPLTQAITAEGRAVGATALWSALNAAVLVSRDLWALFDRIDLLLTPMLAGPPRSLGWLPTDHRDPDRHFAAMSGFAPLASLANASGFPAITLPFGADATGLPLPVQMIAPMGAEALLIATAGWLEAEGRWTHPFPVAGLAP